MAKVRSGTHYTPVPHPPHLAAAQSSRQDYSGHCIRWKCGQQEEGEVVCTRDCSITTQR